MRSSHHFPARRSSDLADDGMILVSQGHATLVGGVREITGSLDNEGTLELGAPGLQLDGSGAGDVNVGTITLSGGNLTVLQSSDGRFTNTGTIDVESGR